MMKISLCMIVKDEEATLGRCLDSAKNAADEIVVADTGSADQTKEIARRYGANVYDFAWIDDFSAARNFAFSKATGDYLLWLDADDVLPEKSLSLLPQLRETLERDSPDVVMCPYDAAFDSAGNPTLSFFRERFLKRTSNFVWQGRVHECVAPRGKIIKSGFRVAHLSSQKERGNRNLLIYLKWAEEERLSPRDLFYYGRELYYHKLYSESAAVLEKSLAEQGWYVNQIEACKILALGYAEQGDSQNALASLFRSFRYGEPRASVCCEIGRLFRADHKLREAAFWYETALHCRDHSDEGDFESPSARTLTPLLELVFCYYHLGDREKALACHKKTKELAPDHPSVLFNSDFFGE